jgi:phosphoenolpyruvate synthase/pyruvate phosphate dikinase
MAVLVQEIINADYAFVIHTTNPLSGNTSEIYAEVKNVFTIHYVTLAMLAFTYSGLCCS